MIKARPNKNRIKTRLNKKKNNNRKTKNSR